jgi:pimeloyl-ACP methyl ester carboxylesterase
MEPVPRQFLGLSPAGFHRTIYWEWAPADPVAPVVVAVHGLTRNGRDFDTLAGVLSEQRRVVCPDIVGRGKSDWLPNGALYTYPQYLADCTALLARLAVASVDWVGTSMGGLIGMMLAAQPLSPIRRLVINDVGPLVPKAALERLAAYVGKDPHFPTHRDLELYMRRAYASFGPLTDLEWAHLARHSVRALPEGGYAMAYDPAIGAALQGPLADVDLWPIWDQIACPVLILHGGQSDLLTPEIVAEMQRRKPDAQLVTFPECGHAPALMAPHQTTAIRHWLSAT